MAEIRARKRGNKWEFRFEAAKIKGKRSQITKGGYKTKKEALDAGAKALSEYNSSGVYFVPSEMSYNDYLDFWIEEYCETNLKKTTVENYKKRIGTHIKPELGKYKLSALTPTALQRFMNKIFNEGYSRNTLTTIRRILSGSFNYAVDTAEFIQSNPMKKVKPPSARAEPETPTRSAPHIYIPVDKIEMIFKRFPEGSSPHIPMMFGYRCGMRLGEAFAICWQDIDFEERTISINKQVQWDVEGKFWYLTNPKYDSFRTIDIDSELYDLLRREYTRQARARAFYGDLYENLYVDDKRRLNTVGRGEAISMVAVRQNGSYVIPRTMQHTSRIIHYDLEFPNFTFHSFRHTHATMLAESGAPINYTQERLGHKDITITMGIYQHVSDSIRKQGAKVLDCMFVEKEA